MDISLWKLRAYGPRYVKIFQPYVDCLLYRRGLCGPELLVSLLSPLRWIIKYSVAYNILD